MEGLEGIINEVADKRIPLRESTQKRLANYCGKGKTYDAGINELMDFYEKHARCGNDNLSPTDKDTEHY